MVVREAVVLVPLDVANPQGGAGQLGGVEVDLQSAHLVRLDRGRQASPPIHGREVDCLSLQVEQGAQGQVEKVAAAAGRVEHFHLEQPLLKPAQPDPRRIIMPVVQEVAGLLLHGLPLPAQWDHHHRLDHQHDVLGAGVVRAEMGALGCVQRPLEQGPED